MICSSLDVMILAKTESRFIVLRWGVRETSEFFGYISCFTGGVSFLFDFYCDFFLSPFLDDTLDGVLDEYWL